MAARRTGAMERSRIKLLQSLFFGDSILLYTRINAKPGQISPLFSTLYLLPPSWFSGALLFRHVDLVNKCTCPWTAAHNVLKELRHIRSTLEAHNVREYIRILCLFKLLVHSVHPRLLVVTLGFSAVNVHRNQECCLTLQTLCLLT